MASIPLYSERFVGVQGLVGVSAYTCPDGYRLVIRDLDAYNGGGFTGTTLFLHGSAGQVIAAAVSSLDASSLTWRGRQIIYAGESFDVTTSGAWDVSVSGYLLVAP